MMSATVSRIRMWVTRLYACRSGEVGAGVIGRTVIAAACLAPIGGTAYGQSDDATAFLERMAGEWSVASEATLGPGQEPIPTDIDVNARLIGGTWMVAEGSGTAAGRSFTWIFTLGYNPAEAQFVGTWIDSNQTYLWTYSGTLDDSGTLTLETEGPIMGNPSTTTQYREIIEVEDTDHHVMRSLILGPDGEWFEFARAEYRRVE